MQLLFVTAKFEILLYKIFAPWRKSMNRICQSHHVFYSTIKSLITSPAIMSPTTDGTKEILPGTDRRASQFRALPGGQIHSLPQPPCITGLIGCSFEYTTFNDFIWRAFNSLRITLASGQTLVL